MKLNKKYSFGDFSGQSFRSRSAEEFNDTEIVGSCFYQEDKPDSRIFPPPMTGVTFKRCNLDNVFIPLGNTVVIEGGDYCCTKRIMVQPPTPKAKPGEDDPPDACVDWIVDKDNKPVEPMDKRQFEEEGRSVDPNDIPDDHEIEITLTAAEYAAITKGQWEAEAAKGNKPLREKFAWFKQEPRIVNSVTRTVVIELYEDQYQLRQQSPEMLFDSPPVVTEREVTRTINVGRDTWEKWQTDGVFGRFIVKPIVWAICKVFVALKGPCKVYRLEGPSTKHNVKGTAWLYRGETAADVDDRKRKLADVRKAVASGGQQAAEGQAPLVQGSSRSSQR